MRIFSSRELDPVRPCLRGRTESRRVDSIQLDPQNPARLDILFSVQSDFRQVDSTEDLA